MAIGYLATVLHAHLPYVRHPEDATVMEEQWLYEAITGTYLPLVQMFEGLLADGVRARATVSVSAPLIEVITSTATHAYFPNMDRNWAAMRAQVHVAADQYERHFGRRTQGIWLGECG